MSRKKEDGFKLDNSITYYLKDHEDDKNKQRKIIERVSGALYYVFGHTLSRGEENGRTLGEG